MSTSRPSRRAATARTTADTRAARDVRSRLDGHVALSFNGMLGAMTSS
jgi:hypothetical protein